jgi:carbon-monoxide dehydrogenase medium subunit
MAILTRAGESGPSLELHVPATLDELEEVVRCLAGRPHSHFAGGLEVVPALRLGGLQVSALVNVTRLPELNGVATAGGRLSVGAATRLAHLERGLPPVLARWLGGVVRQMGNRRVRWQGTLGGNLAGASPVSDLRLALHLLQAELTTVDPGTRRRTTAPVALCREPAARPLAELLVSVTLPVPAAGSLAYAHVRRPALGPLVEAAAATCARASDGRSGWLFRTGRIAAGRGAEQAQVLVREAELGEFLRGGVHGRVVVAGAGPAGDGPSHEAVASWGDAATVPVLVRRACRDAHRALLDGAA